MIQNFDEFLSEEKKDFAESVIEIIDNVKKRCEKDFKHKELFISMANLFDFTKNKSTQRRLIAFPEEIYTRKTIDELNIIFKKMLKIRPEDSDWKEKIPWKEGIYFFQLYLTEDVIIGKQNIGCNFYLSPEMEIVVQAWDRVSINKAVTEKFYTYPLKISRGVITGIKTGIV
jgi:hypothetical protein